LQPKNFKFGGGVADSVVNPAVLVLILIVGILILVGPRHRIIRAFIAAAILIPIDQVLVIFGLHFPMLRVMALFGIVRLARERLAKHQVFSGGINKIDIFVILLVVSTAIAGVLLFQESAEVIYQIGNIYTAFGLYFLLRFLLRDERDVYIMIRTLAWCAIPIAMVMTWEAVTGHNPYALLGGARASVYANVEVRSGRFRAQGCFANSILAGTFGAMTLPLFFLQWRTGKKNTRLTAALGMVAATVITLASNSSTPMLAYAAGIGGLCLWPIRNWMRFVRWGIVTTLVSLHMVMKAPVWHLIGMIDISGGSSSDHRFQLVDQCIRHFGDWWLVGVKSTGDWGWDMFDMANQYVSVCDNSGLLPFICFLAILAYGYKFVGKARKETADRKKQIFFWALGASLFANTIAFVGVSYWDQMQAVWFALLAGISAAVLTTSKKEPVGLNPRVEDGSNSADIYPSTHADDEAAASLLRLQLPHTLFTF
jgi:hypothetical protein